MAMTDKEFSERLIKTKRRWAQIEQSFQSEDELYEEIDEVEEEQEQQQQQQEEKPEEKRDEILGIFDEYVDE